jgi:hypothetical protein
MLAMADDRSEVRSSIPGLARASGVSIEECEDALKCFLSPDPYSRSQEHEGRRIEEVDGGWKLLNGDKYRAMRSAEERREYQRRWKAEKRAKEKNKKPKTKSQTELPKEIDAHLWNEFLLVRKKKKAVDSPTAIKSILNNLEKITDTGKYTYNEAIITAIENSWKTIKLEWLENLEVNNGTHQKSNKQRTGADVFADDLDNIRQNGHEI